MHAGTVVRNVRLISGLVLMAFVTSHLANLSIGIHSLAAMEAWRAHLMDPWRSWYGESLLLGAAFIHVALGLYAISARRALTLSRTDVAQLVLGLLTPPLLLNHVVVTYMADQVTPDFDSAYGMMLAVYWKFSPAYAFQQLFVVVIVWIHGALGLYSWLVLKPVWRRIGGLVLPVIFAVPILALVGFAESGKEVLEKLANDATWQAHITDNIGRIVKVTSQMDALQARILLIYGGLLLIAIAVFVARMLHERFTPVRISYDGGLSAQGRRGLSVLELSLLNDIPHAHVCSARGRCGTCRVHVDAGAQALSPVNDIERATLARVSEGKPVGEGLRLACQARVLGAGVAVTRLLPAYADASAARLPQEWLADPRRASAGPGVMNWLLRALCIAAFSLASGAPALAAPDEHSLAEMSMGALAETKARIEALAGNFAHAPGELHQLTERTRKSLMSGAGVRGFTYLLILLLVGGAAEWLYWTYAYSPLRAIHATSVSSPLEALRLGLRRLLLLVAGMLLFTFAAIGASAAFSWPPGMHELVIALTLLLLALRLSWVAITIVVAPGRPQFKLVPVDPGRAGWLAATAVAALSLLALGQFVPTILERAAEARHVAGLLRFAAYAVATLILLVGAFAFFGRANGRSGLARAPRFPRSFLLALLVATVFIAWMMSARVAAVALIVAIVMALQLGLREMVYFYWRGERDSAEAQGALPAIVLSLARFVVVLAGIGAAALALDTPLTVLAESVSPWVRIGLRLLGVAVLALLAHGVWIAVRSVVDHRLASIGPVDPHHAPDASSRLLTLLPLLRVTTAVVLMVMLVLSSLWALGIEITPLLAGAGVLGIALGFGAQALVRDVIAGIFFLAEDAFRVGEYIESGTNTKGTVERITLRSVALRHHNGPLHFVPYGALGTVRNTSRDWVIDKFNLPLPIEVESETIRKMIKKIGEQMKEDPDLGRYLLEPLKGKLYRVDPGVKIFRCKFRSPPGKQFDLRASALKRIEAALKKLGLGFADGRQTILLQPPSGTPTA